MALALMKGVSDVLRTDTAGKVGRDAYLLAHTQVVAYELLGRLAESAGDTQTVERAREHLVEDKWCAEEVSEPGTRSPRSRCRVGAARPPRRAPLPSSERPNGHAGPALIASRDLRVSSC